MNGENDNNDTQSQEEWEMYLEVFLDETDENLESLVQALLRLEDDSHDAEALNEAFRLLHTHKGSAGLMGFSGISALAHDLESRFEKFRSEKATLDRRTITALLRCVDFFRVFNSQLRAGERPQQDASQVLRELAEIEQQTREAEPNIQPPASSTPEPPPGLQSLQGGYRIRVEFEQGLQLTDMKARLIVARLSNIGEIVATDPPIEDMQSLDDLSQFVLICLTDRDPAEVQKIANVDGVRSVQIEGSAATSITDGDARNRPPESVRPSPAGGAVGPVARVADEDTAPSPTAPSPTAPSPTAAVSNAPVSDAPVSDAAASDTAASDTAAPDTAAPAADSNRGAATETVRVGIDRLDKLMNLTGELVVTRERIVQIAGEIHSVYRATGKSSRAADVSERIRIGLAKIRERLARNDGDGDGNEWRELFESLGADIDAVEEQFGAWEEGRRHVTRITETVDQLNRVSGNLQQCVLETRMVPVAPLFNRFRRVIRDLAAERNKQVQLVIRGEKTELDKRMIDELGDPLLHLVRNSLDHGLETPEERRRLGKPETGTIVLEASHSGNNVFITIGDDGRGVSVDRIRQRILDRGLAPESALGEMSEQQIIGYIWEPGFSTADHVSEISGRGVGMDVVKNRIAELNGSIDIETAPGEGASFRLRLPLTLAIIRCLLVRFRAGFFSLPIDSVREIVSVEPSQIHSVHGSETIDVRGEFIPLIRMNRVFRWHQANYHATLRDNSPGDDNPPGIVKLVNVVVVRTAGRTIGLCVDELLGSADIVVKSLSDNFVDIRGLSGASIMGDGAVCLMLDTTEVINMATERPNGSRPVRAKL